jgi:hypothetical protein
MLRAGLSFASAILMAIGLLKRSVPGADVASAIPQPVTVASYSPKFPQHDGAETGPSTAGMVVCPETAKTGLIGGLLHVR